jgi:hypothetical protein
VSDETKPFVVDAVGSPQDESERAAVDAFLRDVENRNQPVELAPSDSLSREAELLLNKRIAAAQATANGLLAAMAAQGDLGWELRDRLEQALPQWFAHRETPGWFQEIETDCGKRSTFLRTLKWRTSGIAKSVLVAYFQHAAKEQLIRSLKVICTVDDMDEVAETIAHLVPRVGSALRNEAIEDALQTTEGIKASWRRGSALRAIVTNLPDDLVTRGIACALTIKDPSDRVSILSSMASRNSGHVRATVLSHAMTVVWEITMHGGRLRACLNSRRFSALSNWRPQRIGS